jgi:DNA-binding CsgD family transcriptional regulator
VQLAAADPVGDPSRLWAAAATLGLDRSSVIPAIEDGLILMNPGVRFAHPLARSAVYQAASAADRRAAHAALAVATCRGADPDRRAWHRAEAAIGPDEEIARELDRCADRARGRGGLAAAAAFRKRAALLTPDAQDRIVRLIAAAEVTRDTGSLDTALDLLELVDECLIGEREIARMRRLRGQIALAQQRTADAVSDLLAAAPKIMTCDPRKAREVYLEALVGTIWTAAVNDTDSIKRVAAAIEPADVATSPAGDNGDDMAALVLEGLRRFIAEGYETAALVMRRAVDLMVASPDAAPPTLAYRPVLSLPIALWDEDAWVSLLEHVVTSARREGALFVLPIGLNFLAVHQMWVGDLAASARLLDESRAIISVTPGAYSTQPEMMLAAWLGDEESTLRLSAEIRELHASGLRNAVFLTDYAEAVLFNGTGRFGQAYVVARRLFHIDQFPMGTLVASELADAASRIGAEGDLHVLDAWLQQRVRTTPGPWVLGVAERVQALLSEDAAAEAHFGRSLAHLSHTRSRTELARSQLMLGEWLRRQGRRKDAMYALREAHRLFLAIGAQAFADRAVRELRATGDPSMREVAAERGPLTAQEAQVAALASEGLTNPEIAARLFISPRTVQYHLRKVFLKLGITSRAQLPERVGCDPCSKTLT